MQDVRAFTVRAEWDPEAEVWYVSESDVPGLATEAATIEELKRKLDVMVPELIELNAHLLEEPVHGHVPVNLITHQQLNVFAG
jgi:predicted RNase H-like HicB family nuclease